MMSIQEIKAKVNSEIRRKKSIALKIAELKADMKATNKALHFWECELKRAKAKQK